MWFNNIFIGQLRALKISSQINIKKLSIHISWSIIPAFHGFILRTLTLDFIAHIFHTVVMKSIILPSRYRILIYRFLFTYFETPFCCFRSLLVFDPYPFPFVAPPDPRDHNLNLLLLRMLPQKLEQLLSGFWERIFFTYFNVKKILPNNCPIPPEDHDLNIFESTLHESASTKTWLSWKVVFFLRKIFYKDVLYIFLCKTGSPRLPPPNPGIWFDTPGDHGLNILNLPNLGMLQHKFELFWTNCFSTEDFWKIPKPIIISHLKRPWPFIWTLFNARHTVMFRAKLGWKSIKLFWRR